MRRSGRAALVALLLALASPAAAHHLASGDTRASGVPIASLTHGQIPELLYERVRLGILDHYRRKRLRQVNRTS